MSNIDISFCREELKRVMVDVRAHIRDKPVQSDVPELLRPDRDKPVTDAWVYKVGKDHWEFHFGPYHWHGSASNAYDARAKGWAGWLRKQGVEGYAL